MTIQNHILPATIAAAFHAALLWGWIATPPPTRTHVFEVPLPPIPRNPDDAVVPQPEDRSDSPPAVRPLPGASPITLDELPQTPKPMDCTIPVEEPRTDISHDLKMAPVQLGPNEVGLEGPGTERTGIFSPKQLDRIPRATVRPPPRYPVALQQAGIAGSVTVEFDVDPTGRVVRAVAIRCSHREFADPAVRAVLQWHFEPGRRNGRPVAFRMAVPIEFNLSAD